MLFPDESYRVMGACFEVHNRMGCGFTEVDPSHLMLARRISALESSQASLG